MQVKGITVDFSVKNHYNSNNECVRNGISLILGARYQLKNLCDKLSLPIFAYSGTEGIENDIYWQSSFIVRRV